MTRENMGKRTFMASLGLCVLTGLAACSGASTGTPDPGTSGGDGTGSGSSGSSGSHSGSSSSSGSSTGDDDSGSTGSTSGSSSGSSSGSTSGSSSGSGSGSTSGDGGTSATDLAAPAAADGIQVATPAYNASDPYASLMAVGPGQEIFLCYYYTLPNTGEVDVGAFQSYMSAGSSHHFIVFQGGGNSGAGAFFGNHASGSIVPCVVGNGTWVYATSTPGEVVGMKMPDTVGLPFAAGTQIVLNMHFINTSTKTLYPSAKLNILFAKNVKYKAAAMVSFNSQINIPPGTTTNPGKQTVGGTCTAPPGSKFFIMSTHSHKWASSVIVTYNPAQGAPREIVHTSSPSDPKPATPADQEPGTGTDYEHPGVGQWLAPNFLTTSAGDSFKYSCSYSNTSSNTVTVGETAAKNEMCMAIGYYYPAGSASCN